MTEKPSLLHIFERQAGQPAEADRLFEGHGAGRWGGLRQLGGREAAAAAAVAIQPASTAPFRPTALSPQMKGGGKDTEFTTFGSCGYRHCVFRAVQGKTRYRYSSLEALVKT